MISSEASSSNGGGGESVVVDVGRRRSTCGYCKSGRRTSISHGIWANSLTVYDYEELLDRGWRRSGYFLYKPELEMACCPAYTIRLRAQDFSPSKEQIRVSKRMQRYLDGMWDGKKEPADISGNSHGRTYDSNLSDSSRLESGGSNEQKTKEEELMGYLSKQIDNALQSFVKDKNLPCDIQYPQSIVNKISQTKKRRLVRGSEDLLYTSNISFQIAAILRRAKSDENNVLLSRGKKESLDEQSSMTIMDGSSYDLSPKYISEELTNVLQDLVKVPEISIQACNGHLNFYSAVKGGHSDEEFHLVAVSRESSAQKSKECDVIRDKLQRKERRLEIHLNRSAFDPEEFSLFKKYQINVHNDEPDEVTEQSYRRFLVDSPFIYVPPSGNETVPPCGFGSFHQQYRIDGRLIAVGVIDILPKCLSSVYLFWDPDFAFLSLGKYSVLQEISWVKENQCHYPSLQYYYLGYYIHSCSKMRYKAAYWPSELLCPLRYKWVPFDIAKPLLDRAKYAVLSDYIDMQKENSSSIQESGKLLDQQNDDLGDGDLNDFCVGGDDFNSSDEEMFPEINELAADPIQNDVGRLQLDLRGTRVKYKDLQPGLRPADRMPLEKQLSRFMTVVGPELSEKMVYSLG
ncbi:arginyl-tRNA--protein transferase 2-like isoform X1 [Amaranthus tricolor]|uniref:arginyl-tRNA--protein transferase 2-like isoform X1 n=1 Tax=Amaranthus tricolor TaxID=29722 RepID=UPI00258743F2|nr:arginyl-tRNA--protein transferase 2-like isoform X1 [Amaranthus tricolor]